MKITVSPREIAGWIFLILCLNPYLATYSPILLIGVFVIWNIFAFLINQQLYNNIVSQKSLWLMILYIFYVIIVRGVNSLSSHDLLMPCIAFFGLYYMKIENKKKKQHLVNITVIYCTIIAFYSIYKFTVTPNLCRILLSSDDEVIRRYGSPLTADYYFVYALVLIECFLLIQYLKKKDKKYIFFWILFFVLICKSAYTIAIIMTMIICALGVGMYAVYNVKNKKVVFGLFIGIVFMVILLAELENILMYLIQIDINPVIKKRIQYIYYYLFDNQRLGATTDLGLRISFYKMSFNTFIQHFIIGSGDGIGGHSSVLDLLARYGIIGNTLYYGGVFSLIKRLKEMIKNKDVWILRYLIFCFLLIGFINPVFNRLPYTVLFVVIPLMCQLDYDNQQ